MELSEEGQKAKAQFQKKVEGVQQDLKTKQDELNSTPGWKTAAEALEHLLRSAHTDAVATTD